MNVERTKQIVAQAVQVLQAKTIAIPRITVIPRDGSGSGFHDFDLDCSCIRQSYVAKNVIVTSLGDNRTERLRAGSTERREARLEDYLVRNLMDSRTSTT